MRWVDDIWIAVLAFLSRDLPQNAKQRMEMIKGAYNSKGLELKSEDPNIFAGISLVWCQSESCFKFRQKFLDAAILDRKYQNDWSFSSESVTIGLITGRMIGCLNKVMHRELICLKFVGVGLLSIG